MKIIIIATLILIPSAFLKGQILKGNMMMGGTFDLSTSSSDRAKTLFLDATATKQNVFTISPRYGLFVGKNLMFGLGVEYSNTFIEHSQTFSQSNVTYKQSLRSTAYSSSIFMRNYKKIGDSFALFLHSGVNAGIGNFESKEPATDGNGQQLPPNKEKGKITQWDFSIKSGLNYFLSKKCMLEATFGLLGYSNYQLKPNVTAATYNQTTKSSGFNGKLNASTLSFGMYYFVNR